MSRLASLRSRATRTLTWLALHPHAARALLFLAALAVATVWAGLASQAAFAWGPAPTPPCVDGSGGGC